MHAAQAAAVRAVRKILQARQPARSRDLRALADWRAARGAPYDARDRRFHVARLYTQQRLCLFCTQFFDKTYSDYVQYHRNATVVSDPVLRLEDVPGEESAFEPELTKRLVRQRARMRGGAASVQPRPEAARVVLR